MDDPIVTMSVRHDFGFKVINRRHIISEPYLNNGDLIDTLIALVEDPNFESLAAHGNTETE